MITALQTRSPTHTDSPESSAAAAPSQGDAGGQRERAEENHAGDEGETRTAEPDAGRRRCWPACDCKYRVRDSGGAAQEAASPAQLVLIG